MKSFVLSMVLFCNLSVDVFGQGDFSKLFDLIDENKLTTFSAIKQLRENNSQNLQQAPLFDFGFGLAAINLGRMKEAVEVLQPFVDKRPKVFQARLLLIRAYVELDQFDSAVLQSEKLLAGFPSQDEPSKRIARHIGALVGYMNFARPDCNNELTLRLEKSADASIPKHSVNDYRESIRMVETKVASIHDEIAKAEDKAELDADAKAASNLSDAEKIREAVQKETDQLQDREKMRNEKFDQLELQVRNMETTYANLNANYNRLENLNSSLRREQRSLERIETTKDKDGNKKTRTVIQDETRYRRLGREISSNEAEMVRTKANGNILINNREQLRAQAVGLVNQKQLDQLFSNTKMGQLDQAAKIKEKKAEIASNSKGKSVSATRVLNAKLKSFSTYDPLDIASNKEFLKEAVDRIGNK